jgi:putative transposase
VAVAVADQRLIPFAGKMTPLFVAPLASIRATISSRLELPAEILALRHQLAVLQRTTLKRPRLRPIDRPLWMLLSRVWPNWRQAVQIVTPATVVRWHRRAFTAYWGWNSRPRRVGRPALAPDLRALIRQMRQASPLWGAPRIYGELQKLGIVVSQPPWRSTLGVRLVPRPSRGTPSSPITSPSSPRSTSSPSPPSRSASCLCSWR